MGALSCDHVIPVVAIFGLASIPSSRKCLSRDSAIVLERYYINSSCYCAVLFGKAEIKSPKTPSPGRQSKITPARFFALIVIQIPVYFDYIQGQWQQYVIGNEVC